MATYIKVVIEVDSPLADPDNDTGVTEAAYEGFFDPFANPDYKTVLPEGMSIVLGPVRCDENGDEI